MTVAGITFVFSRRDPSEVLISARVASPCQSHFDNLGGHRVAEVDMPAPQMHPWTLAAGSHSQVTSLPSRALRSRERARYVPDQRVYDSESRSLQSLGHARSADQEQMIVGPSTLARRYSCDGSDKKGVM